jgi:hypothetical protein
MIGVIQHYIDNTVHKLWVLYYLSRFIYYLCENSQIAKQLIWRGITHDLSKYGWTETKHFMRALKHRGRTNYGTLEYNEYLKILKPALDHHYQKNSHHPQHYDGTTDLMSHVDQIEMLCDWLASVKRNDNGNIFNSIEINQKRFNYTDERKNMYLTIVRVVK